MMKSASCMGSVESFVQPGKISQPANKSLRIFRL
jgi:hypothetical protein